MSLLAGLLFLLPGLVLPHPGYRVSRQSETAAATSGDGSSTSAGGTPAAGGGVKVAMSGAPVLPAVAAMPAVPGMSVADVPYQPTGAEVMALFNRILEQVQMISQQTARFSGGRNDLGGGWPGPWGWQWGQTEFDPSIQMLGFGGGGGGGGGAAGGAFVDDPGFASRSSWEAGGGVRGGWVDPGTRAGWRGALDPSVGATGRFDPGLAAVAGSRGVGPGAGAWAPTPDGLAALGPAGSASASVSPSGVTGAAGGSGFDRPGSTGNRLSGFGGPAGFRPAVPRFDFGGPIRFGGGPGGGFRDPGGLNPDGPSGLGSNVGRGLSGQGGFSGAASYSPAANSGFGGGSRNGGGRNAAAGSSNREELNGRGNGIGRGVAGNGAGGGGFTGNGRSDGGVVGNDRSDGGIAGNDRSGGGVVANDRSDGLRRGSSGSTSGGEGGSAGLEGGFVGSNGGQVGAGAAGFLGPNGGFGSAQVFGPGPDVRFGEGGPIDSSPGGFKSVVSSSSSGTSTVDGKTTSFKESFVGLNDNGKVTTFTAHDP